MSDEGHTEVPLPDHLHTVVVGLRHLGRKCSTLADRHPDFPTMAERFQEMADAVERDHDRVDWASFARMTEPAVTLFEGAGFMTVAREADRLRESLAARAPEEVASVELRTRRAFAASTARRDEDGHGPGRVVVDLDEELDGGGGREWLPVRVLILILVVASAATILLVKRHLAQIEAERQARWNPVEVAVEPTATPLPPRPTATRVPLSEDMAERAAAFANHISEARLALRAGDLELARARLWDAARIDRDHVHTLEVAERLVEGLLGKAEDLVHEGRWSEAETTVGEARQIAVRFGRDVAPVDAAARRHASLPRFIVIDPGATDAILEQSGRRVEISFASGATKTGRIKGMRNGRLLLDQSNRLERGMGAIEYVEEVDLSRVEQIKVWLDR